MWFTLPLPYTQTRLKQLYFQNYKVYNEYGGKNVMIVHKREYALQVNDIVHVRVNIYWVTIDTTFTSELFPLKHGVDTWHHHKNQIIKTSY